VPDGAVEDRSDVDDDVRHGVRRRDGPPGAVGLERDRGLRDHRPHRRLDDAVAHLESERAPRRLQHLLGRARRQERLDAVLHDRHELRRRLRLDVDGHLGLRRVGQDRDPRTRGDGGVDRDGVEAGREDEERDRRERIGLRTGRRDLPRVDREPVDRERGGAAERQVDHRERTLREPPRGRQPDPAGALHAEGRRAAVRPRLVRHRHDLDAVALLLAHDLDVAERGERRAAQQRLARVGGQARGGQIGGVDRDARQRQRLRRAALAQHLQVPGDEGAGARDDLAAHLTALRDGTTRPRDHDDVLGAVGEADAPPARRPVESDHLGADDLGERSEGAGDEEVVVGVVVVHVTEHAGEGVVVEGVRHGTHLRAGAAAPRDRPPAK
ncbi:hypothetical protein FF38_14265, partial [Lucilia cuprina]